MAQPLTYIYHKRKPMTKAELKELVIQELMARTPGIKKPNVDYLNKNDIYDATQTTLDKILDMIERNHGNLEPSEKQRLATALAIFARDILESVDTGIQPADILKNIYEVLNIK